VQDELQRAVDEPPAPAPLPTPKKPTETVSQSGDAHV